MTDVTISVYRLSSVFLDGWRGLCSGKVLRGRKCGGIGRKDKNEALAPAR